MKNINKMICAGMVAVMAISLSGCGGQAVTTREVYVVNPVTECSSEKDMNKAAGTTIQRMDLPGISGESFRTIETEDGIIAEYEYSLDGKTYTLRASKMSEDISGLYIDGKTAFDGMPATDTIDYVFSEDVNAARWESGEEQFVFMTADAETGESGEFEMASELVKDTMDW